MSNVEKVQQLFASFGASVGFEGMGTNGKVTYRLNYDGGLVVNIDYLNDINRFMLAAPILELQGADNAEVCMDLMELNLYWDELAGGRFALMKEARLIMLVRHIELKSVTEESFVHNVSAFIDAAGSWFEALTGKFADEDTGVDENAKNGFVKV